MISMPRRMSKHINVFISKSPFNIFEPGVPLLSVAKTLGKAGSAALPLDLSRSQWVCNQVWIVNKVHFP